MPRSGSTWLQELIWTQPGFKYCNEPLNLKGSYLRRKSGIDGFEELYNKESYSKVFKYFEGFITGKNHFLDPSPLRKFYRIVTDRIVFKVIHGGEYFINDLTSDCNGEVIFLIRHPFAVALSRRALPRLNVLCSDLVLQDFSVHIQKKARIIKREGSFLEQSVLSWCIQNKIALNQRKDNWTFITYEQLTVNPEPILKKVIKRLQLEKPERIYNQLEVPSAVSVQSDNDTMELMLNPEENRLQLIKRWEEKIPVLDRKKLFEIIDLFDIDIYPRDGFYPRQKYLIS